MRNIHHFAERSVDFRFFILIFISIFLFLSIFPLASNLALERFIETKGWMRIEHKKKNKINRRHNFPITFTCILHFSLVFRMEPVRRESILVYKMNSHHTIFNQLLRQNYAHEANYRNYQMHSSLTGGCKKFSLWIQ